MEHNDEDLKLIFVYKIGYTSKNEGLFEFIFSLDPSNIDYEGWCWDIVPACDNALPPTEDYVNAVFTLKTKSFDLACLHEAVDREYMHGYHNIHALAYEVEMIDEDGYSEWENMMEDNDDVPLLVFHYGMTFAQVKDLLYSRKIILRKNNFIESSSVSFDE